MSWGCSCSRSRRHGSLSGSETSVPPAVRVAGLSKSFRLPHEARTTVRDYFLHPLRRTQYEDQRALVDVGFEINRGEFFGVIGRNGSGKSTLLKIIAGIYPPDRGSVEIRGKLSPFIELGVGFNPELTGRENVHVNATLLGLDARELAERFDAIIDFAELHRFVDQKLKNYSSGMQLRLAYAIAIQVPFDILLLDEVLAVGDQNFQDKCFATFDDMRNAGKTVVFVTHGLASVAQFCDRAMLLQDGVVEEIGSPGDVIQAYLARERERTVDVPKSLGETDIADGSPAQPAPAARDERLDDGRTTDLYEIAALRGELKRSERLLQYHSRIVEMLVQRHYPPLSIPPAHLRERMGSGPDETNYLAQGLATSERAIQTFGEAPGEPILEWGCGSGRTLRWLLAFPEWTTAYHGCDEDGEAITWLREQGSFPVEAYDGDAIELPYNSATFGGAFALSMLTRLHPDEHRDWLAELGRVVRERGLVLLGAFGPSLTAAGIGTEPYHLRSIRERGWAFAPRSTGQPLAIVTEDFVRTTADGIFDVERYVEQGHGRTDTYTLRRRAAAISQPSSGSRAD